MESLELEQQRERISMEWRHRQQLEARKGKQLVYDNQQEAAFAIMDAFARGKRYVLLIAQPGVGKTGVAHTIKYQFCTHPDDSRILLTQNAISISGMSDLEWKDQYQKNLIPSFRDTVFHRGNLGRQRDSLKELQNGLLITDECHIASGFEQTVAKVMRDADLLNPVSLEARNLRLLDISATPEGIAEDLKSWGDLWEVVVLQPSPLYKGFQVMLDEFRVREAPDLTDLQQARELFRFFENRYANSTKKFFPFRVISSEAEVNIRICAREFGWDCIRHDSEERIDEVDQLMGNPPLTHTVILVKEFWCASKRVIKNHVGGSYEQPPQKRNTTRTSQGLTARFSDTYAYEGEWLDPTLRPVHFCDLVAVREYLEWFRKGCDYGLSTYSSTRISSTGQDGVVRYQPTKANQGNPTAPPRAPPTETRINPEAFRVFRTFEEAKRFFQALNYTGHTPKASDRDENGCLKTSMNGPKKVYSLRSALKKISGAYGGGGAVRTCIPCYENPTDRSTERFVVLLRRDTPIEKIQEADEAFPPMRFDPVTVTAS